MTNLEKECSSLWSKAVKERDGHKCRVPSCRRAGVDPHHIISKRYANTKFDVDNGVTLCRLHHDHDHPGQLLANVRACISHEEYDRLWEKAQITKTWHEWELKELKQELKGA